MKAMSSFRSWISDSVCTQIRTILLKWKGWNGAWRVFCKLRKFVVKCDMSHLRFFFGPFITKTIANHRTWIWVKPLKNHRCQWSICKKNIQWWWSGGSKTIEKPSLAMVPWKKNITIASFEKNDHRWSLVITITSSIRTLNMILTLC